MRAVYLCGQQWSGHDPNVGVASADDIEGESYITLLIN